MWPGNWERTAPLVRWRGGSLFGAEIVEIIARPTLGCCFRPRSARSTKTSPRTSSLGERRTGYLGLGSNVGDPAAHLRAALELLEAEGIEIDAVSSAYVTEPVGEILDQPDFLNAAVRIRTDLEPEALLDALQAR